MLGYFSQKWNEKRERGRKGRRNCIRDTRASSRSSDKLSSAATMSLFICGQEGWRIGCTEEA